MTDKMASLTRITLKVKLKTGEY